MHDEAGIRRGRRRAGLRRALLAVAAAAIAARCNPSPEHEGTLVPVLRLVDARHLDDGEPSMDHVPTAVVGGVRRPVLAAGRVATLHGTAVVVPADGKITVSIPIPAELRGAGLELTATVQRLKGNLPPEVIRNLPWRQLRWIAEPPVPTDGQRPTMLAPGDARSAVDLAIDTAGPAGDALVIVEGRLAPERVYESSPLLIPPRARLRVATGLAGQHGASASPVTRLALRALTVGGSDPGEGTLLFATDVAPPIDGDAARWHEHDVDLDAFAGREVRLRFEALPDTPETEAFSRAVWGDPTIFAPRPRADRGAPSRPNVLLISLDTLRADHLGAYGYAWATSPVIDTRLAARGTLFERAYTTTPATRAGHLGLLTSLNECVQGVPTRFDRLRADAHTLAELLRAHGYQTAAFTENAWVSARHGFERGFGTFVEDTGPAVTDGHAPSTFRRTVRWIESTADAPWFAFVHTYQVHEPYSPPEGYVARVGGSAAGDVRPEAMIGYDAEIRYTDELLVEILDGLDRTGVVDRTVVVLTSDHGELFGEHGLHGHANAVYEDVLHVPLIIRAPGRLPAGRRIATPVSLIDVAPTILDLLGLPPMVHAQGTSLVALVGSTPPAPRTLYAEWKDTMAARTGSMKWIVNTRTGRAALYDTDTDPEEEHDLAATAPPGSIEAVLAAFRSHCAWVAPPAAAPGAGPDPEIETKLRALGYLEE
jgi:arylsulfatase A-like enzyme